MSYQPSRASIELSREFPNTYDAYEWIEVIGFGKHAEVMRARVKNTGREVAIKKIDLDKYNTALDEILKEIQVMRQLSNKHILKYHTSFVHETNVYFVTDLFEGGSCSDIMRTYSQYGFRDEKLIACILKQALKGLLYLHEKDQMHRDIKGTNILIHSNGRVCLADFGVAAWFVENGDRRQTRQTFVGSPNYMAPEVLDQLTGYDNRADIWSFGITALELANGQPPYANMPPMKIIVMVMDHPPPTLESTINPNNTTKFSKNFKDFIEKCLQKEPEKRWPTAKLLKHPFLKVSNTAKYISENLMAYLPPLSVRLKMLQSNETKEIPLNTNSSGNSNSPETFKSPIITMASPNCDVDFARRNINSNNLAADVDKGNLRKQASVDWDFDTTTTTSDQVNADGKEGNNQ